MLLGLLDWRAGGRHGFCAQMKWNESEASIGRVLAVEVCDYLMQSFLLISLSYFVFSASTEFIFISYRFLWINSFITYGHILHKNYIILRSKGNVFPVFYDTGHLKHEPSNLCNVIP